jgi:hypothetical protein
MDRRGIGETMGSPTPILEGIDQVVVVDRKVRLTKGDGGRERKDEEEEAKNCAHNY